MTKKNHITATGSVSIPVLFNQGGFRFDHAYYFDPEFRWQQDQEIATWCEKTFAPYPIYHAEAHLARIDWQTRPFRQVGGLQPHLLLAAALGADLLLPGDKDPDICGEPLSGKTDRSVLPDIKWAEQEPVKTFLSQLDELRKRYIGQPIDIIPPFFWDISGRAAIHGPLTTAVKLAGNDFFMLACSEPDQAKQLISWIVNAYLDLIVLFADSAAFVLKEIHIGECTGSLFSEEIWENLAVPAINKLAEAAGSVRIHSCGQSDHLLAQMVNIRHLTCLNIGSDTRIKLAREKFGRELKIDLIPDIHLLTGKQTADIRNWINEVLTDNDGGPLEIQFHYDVGMPFKNIETIFSALAERDIPYISYSVVSRWRKFDNYLKP